MCEKNVWVFVIFLPFILFIFAILKNSKVTSFSFFSPLKTLKNPIQLKLITSLRKQLPSPNSQKLIIIEILVLPGFNQRNYFHVWILQEVIFFFGAATKKKKKTSHHIINKKFLKRLPLSLSKVPRTRSFNLRPNFNVPKFCATFSKKKKVIFSYVRSTT